MLTISILILAYMIMGKDVKKLMERLKDVNWRDEIGGLMSKLRPWALKVGRVAARPLLQFYYVLEDENTSIRERVMIMLPLSTPYCLLT